MRILIALISFTLCAPVFAQTPTTSKIKKTKVPKQILNPKLKTKKKSAKPAKNEKPLPPVVGKNGLIAQVNGVKIPLSAFSEQYDRFAKTFQARKRNVPNRIAQRYRDSIVKRLIEDELIRQETKAQNISVNAKELDVEFQKYKEMFKEEKRFQRYLTTAKLTEAKVKNNLKKSLSLKLLMKSLGANDVTEKAVRAYYQKNKAKYNVKEQVRASHILLKVSKDAAPDKIEELRKKAEGFAKKSRGGADFAQLAKDNSEGPTAKRGGDLSYFTRGRMVKEFDDKAFSMKVNEISDPVRTRFGWHVIKVTERKEPRLRPFDEVKDNIERMLSNRASREARSTLLEKLKAKAKIETYLP